LMVMQHVASVSAFGVRARRFAIADAAGTKCTWRCAAGSRAPTLHFNRSARCHAPRRRAVSREKLST